MTTAGKIESFDDTTGNWETYVERVKHVFLEKTENRAISSEFVVPNSKASLSKQPKPQRYMLLRLMLMPMKTY